MSNEARRRAYLSAMQVVSWLPRVVLPFAAPSRPELLEPPMAEPIAEPIQPLSETRSAAVAPAEPAQALATPAPRPKIQVPRPGAVARPDQAPVPEEAGEALETRPATLPPPRFALQLLRAGSCLLLVELPTGERFQSRDPAYLLLKDLLRAAGLPDNPQQVGDGEPIRWPLFSRGNLDQGPDAARDYVQGVISAELQQSPSVCLWLVGLPALRFAGEADEQTYNLELAIDGIGTAWALPGLELLMDEPQRKAELWQAMRRMMVRWKADQ